MDFVQDNQSIWVKGVLRGLYYQKQFPQGKLVRTIRGSVFDVAVDLRSGSKTFGQWYGVELNEDNKKQFYISEGFAGFPCYGHGGRTDIEDSNVRPKENTVQRRRGRDSGGGAEQTHGGAWPSGLLL